jgi:IS4 transposase
VELGAGRKTRFRFKNPLLSIDSSVVTLALSIFPWARWSRQKGAIKLHMTLDHAGYLPQALVITTGKYSEVEIARRAHYEAGTIVAMDRGFIDYRWFHRLNEAGVFFVTRLKKDVPYAVVDTAPVFSNKGVIADQRIQLTGKGSRKKYPQVLRLITFDTEEGQRFEFLTNQLTLAAATIADIYKDRWQIETFFKLLKQNLRVKTFLGTSPNAVWTQIWAAMIAMLLIKVLQLKSRYGWSFANLVYFLRMNLFVHRDLWEWLHDPFPDVGTPTRPQQLHFWRC